MAGFVEFVGAHPGLFVFTVVSVAIVAYLLYAMVNPTHF